MTVDNSESIEETVIQTENSICQSNGGVKSVDQIESIENTNKIIIHKSAQHKMTKKKKCCTLAITLVGASTFLLGLSWLIYTPYRMFLTERLQMRPGLPPFEWWKTPEPEVRLRAYIFTVANAERFLEGIDTKLRLEEFGPIVYRERIEHKDIEFHENSTMSYTIHRYLEFLPDQNPPGILNETIVVPNIVLLGMASLVHKWGPAAKIAFRLVSNKDKVFINSTVYNYLWNSTTEALDAVVPYLPTFLIPQDNGGALYNVYKDFEDRVNVKIGTKYGYKEFFQINTFNGRPTVPGFRPEYGDCFASLMNSTEGALYPNFLTKDTVIYYWRKTVCRPVPLYFAKELKKGSLKAYKYETHTSMYDRFEDEASDCYKYRGSDVLPSGLSDVSKCYHNMPVVVSAPHFYGRDGFWNDQLEGFRPNKRKHGSYAIIEPITGVPIEQCARSQSNMYMPKLSGFKNKLQIFSEMLVPMTWLEYHQEKLTPEIDAMLIFTVNILPILQYVLSAIFITAGVVFVVLAIEQLKFARRHKKLAIKIAKSNLEAETNSLKELT